MAYESSLTIATVMQDIFSNKYVLPSIQRDYVWDTEQIQDLFDSLMQDYPIGAFLFWEIDESKLVDYNFYEFLRNYHEKDANHIKLIDLKGAKGVTAVLDGQQRLTSLYIGLKGSYAYRLKYRREKNSESYPVRYLYLNLVEDAESETNKYDFRFLTNNEKAGMKGGYWFKVGDILNMTKPKDPEFFVSENLSESFFSQNQIEHAISTLSKLYSVIHTDYTLCYYKEKSSELDKVLNIFVRVNSGGTVLSYSDLLLSIASAQWKKHDAREEIIDFVSEINDIGDKFQITKDFVLKAALVLTDFTDIAFKVDNFNNDNMVKIEERWEIIKKAIKQTVNLVASFGYSRENLSSNNALIPIAYYLLTMGIPRNFVTSRKYRDSREKIKKWLILSLLKKVFSGQPDNVIRPIREIIKNNGINDYPLDKIIDKFKGTNKSISFTGEDIEEHLLKLKYGKSDTLYTLMLLYQPSDFKNIFHEDHMYPKSKFKRRELAKNGVPKDQIDKYLEAVDDIGNLQLLPKIVNEEKNDTDFDKWFNETNRSKNDKTQYRKIHYLPDMEYTYPNFLEFIEKRKQRLKERLIEILL
ncbi:MAG: DUF262 domain-containing protein [Ruminobacter sp.]|uniref:DUF262 domain-containing protein n=1 Tax=Ruminobacter sp. TaxID=2774296 RepID=UPI00257EA0EB|nr:DUF262 domain-containing protein [Ruminobacter sp.]MBQ3774703.1 DUF262 domain-containing protein [Ruminobacter sp.]